MIARDIVRITTQCSKMTEFIGQLSAVSLRISSISSLNELSNAMECAGKAICLVSNKLDSGKLRDMAKVMAKEDAKLEMKQDMMQDVLDSLGEGMDDPVEQEELYKQVLADVGLEVDKVLPDSNVTSVQAQAQKEEQKMPALAEGGGDDDLDAMLKSLQK